MTHIYQLNIKARDEGHPGLPKHPVHSVNVNFNGFEGDFNNYRAKKGGKSEWAVSLMNYAKMLQLQDEGWNVQPGDLGENITTLGLEDISVSNVYQAGDLIIRITEPMKPCSNLAILPYVGQDMLKKFQQATMHNRGWYAEVLNPGRIEKGYTIERIC